MQEGCIPQDWKSSVVLPIYKGKGDPMECGSYRGIKLLEHAMKVAEKIFEHRIRQQINIDDVQFGFMKGNGTTDAIFMSRQMQENFRAKDRNLHFSFVDLETAFDRVAREVISSAMRKLGVEEWLVSAVMSMYTDAKTVVRTFYGNSKGFKVKVGMHQGSAVSPFLFVIVMEAISREFRVALPWELLYADDLVVIAETEEELIKRLNEWKDNAESKGMRVNINKTKVMISGERQIVRQKAVKWPCGVCCKGVGRNSLLCTSCQKWVHKKCSGIKGSMSKVVKSFTCRGCLNPVTGAGRTSVDIGASANLEVVEKFCYLGDMLSVEGDADAAVEARIRIGWNKFRQLVPLLTNKDVSLFMRGRLYSSCVRSSMLHGSETWPVRKENVVALQRAEMRMVRWMCGTKLKDRLPSKELREKLGTDDIALVLQQNRLRWYGHVLRKEDDDWVKKCMEYEVEGPRPRGRPKRTWREVVKEDCLARKLKKVDRSKWRKLIKNVGCEWVSVSSGTGLPGLS